jgi:molybdopterin synthase catalytic subunit
MANADSEVLLTDARLEAPKEDVDLSAGAIVEFWGVVRQMEDGREITGINYEAHEAMARHQLKLIADAAEEKFQVKRVVLHHRMGFVPTGEPSLFLRVSAPHRGEAFEASKWIVDELKKKVPIWKKPAFGPSRTGGKATAGRPNETLVSRR